MHCHRYKIIFYFGNNLDLFMRIKLVYNKIECYN